MDSLERLEEIGFRRVGNWKLVSGKPEFTLESAAQAQDVLYAFVTGREILYVGKTTRPLHKRMYGYQRPGPTQRTNIAGHTKIADLLGRKQPLDIYALASTETLRRGSFEINLAAGLEDSVIRELQPAWNAMGR